MAEQQTTHDWFHQTRERIEAGFARWGEICYNHPKKILLVIILFVAYVSMSLPNIRVDTSTEGFLHEDDPIRLTYDQFQREFSRDERALVLAEGDVFSLEFLQRLQKLHQALSQISQVHDVDSLVDARLVYGEDDELIIEDLLENFPQTEADVARIRERVMANPVYRKQFINDDMNLTTLVITADNYSRHIDANNPPPAEERPFITGEEMGEIVEKIDAVLAEHQAPGFVLSAAGSPHMMYLLTQILGKDMFLFSALGIASIAVILALLYRRWVMVLLPVTVSMLSTYFTVALMVFMDVPVTSSIQILPSFLLAVGVGNSVHVFTAFFQGLNRGLDKKGALGYALGHAGLAVTMTGLTTAGGLLSFITAEIKPIADFGFVTPMGIMCALFFSLVMLPALIALLPIKNKALTDESGSWYQRFLHACAWVSTTHPKRVVLVWALLVLPALVLVTQIRISHTPLYWFPADTPFRLATEKYDREMGGSTYMEFIVDTGRPQGLKDPDVQQRMAAITDYVLGLNVNTMQVGKAVSLIDITRELNQALHGNDPAYYSVPDDPELLAQEFLLYELSGDEDMQETMNEDFSKGRMTFQLPMTDAVNFPGYLDAVEEGVLKIMGDKAEVIFSGVFVMMGRTVYAMLHSTVTSYIIAFCIITPLMVFLIGSLRVGLLSMIPNIVPIIMTMGLMQLMGIKLDAFTLLIGSIALGLAVDDTIHFMHNYQRFYAQLGDARQAVFKTLRTTGQAILFTSLVLSIAFFINMFATMENLFAFGLLTGFCIVVAFLADVLLAPALVTLLAARDQRRAEQA